MNKIIILFSLSLMFISCAPQLSTVVNTPGVASSYEDVRSTGRINGVGIESQDIIGMTDRMMRDMLSNSIISNSSKPPRIIVDDKYFTNESSSRLNKRLITERLMINLNRAAQGRIIFIERQSYGMLQEELEMNDKTSENDISKLRKTLAADFRLTGKIMSLDSIKPSSGTHMRYHQISFKLVDLKKGITIWSGIYEFKKSSQDDILYR